MKHSRKHEWCREIVLSVTQLDNNYNNCHVFVVRLYVPTEGNRGVDVNNDNNAMVRSKLVDIDLMLIEKTISIAIYVYVWIKWSCCVGHFWVGVYECFAFLWDHFTLRKMCDARWSVDGNQRSKNVCGITETMERNKNCIHDPTVHCHYIHDKCIYLYIM